MFPENTRTYTPNKIDLQYLKALWDNPTLGFRSKVNYTYFEDVLVRNIFKMTIRAINEKGIFLPRVDLKEFIEDEDRMEKYEEIGYPLKIVDCESIIDYVNKYETKTSFKALEKIISQRWLRKQLKALNKKMEEDIINSNVSSSEILRKFSTKIDNLLYTDDDEKEVLSVQEMYEDEIQYQMNNEVEEFYPTGNPLIDKMNGGLNAPSFTCIVGAAKAGKSISLYQNVIASLEAGKNVILGTIEIPSAEAKRKIYSLYSGIPFKKINKKQWDSEEERQHYFNKIEEFKEKYNDQLFIYYRKSGFCAKDIESYAAGLERTGIKIHDIVLDYMLIMKSNDDIRGIGGIDYAMKVPKELRVLSQKLHARVFSAAQMHSSAEPKEIEKITFDDIYLMKNCAHECTYLLAIKRNLEKLNMNGEPELFSKIILARQEWTPEVYHYPEYNYSCISMGDAILYKDATDGVYWEEI